MHWQWQLLASSEAAEKAVELVARLAEVPGREQPLALVGARWVVAVVLGWFGLPGGPEQRLGQSQYSLRRSRDCPVVG